MDRILLLDGIRGQLDSPIILDSTEELRNITEKCGMLEIPPDLTLDIRNLPQIHFNSLLKFIEDYRGSITLVANDNPVSKPILSRFIEIYKNPEISEKVSDIRYHKIMKGSFFMTNNMKSKILDFLEINVSNETYENDLEYIEDDEYEEEYE